MIQKTILRWELLLKPKTNEELLKKLVDKQIQDQIINENIYVPESSKRN